MNKNLFKGRKILIATKHQKEKVITPILENGLGVLSFTSLNFDTDTLGTFTGEIERQNNPITTVRNKCLLAMNLYDCDLGIANEGSFGPHPSAFYLPADEEYMIFIDKKNKLEIVEKILSTHTNFSGIEIKSEEDLIEFAKSVQFPSHALILKIPEKQISYKGICEWETLLTSYYNLLEQSNTVFAETDMRAMFNPSRMKVIEELTNKLLHKIKSLCPKCETPGFGVSSSKSGLPCVICHSPTKSTLSYIYTCQKCNYVEEQKYPHQKHFEDAQFCDVCNP